MILGYNDIKAALDSGAWTCHRDGVRVGSEQLTVNSNSCNVTLSHKFLVPIARDRFIDFHDDNSVEWRPYENEILRLDPRDFLLGCTRERFNCNAPLVIHGRERYFAQMIEGRSTAGRCSFSSHECAGFGDYGFDANFTLEISCRLPVIAYAGDEIAQIQFVEVSSPTKYTSVYADQYDEPREPRLGFTRFVREYSQGEKA